MSKMNMVQAICLALDEEMLRDENVFLMGEDVGRRGGIFNTSRGLLEKYGPQRVIDTPLAEGALVGMAIGAAMAGMRPVVEIQFADYLYGALGQLINEAARIHYRSNGAWRVPLVVRIPYGGGGGGGLYHSQSPEALLAQVPGLKVVVPSDPQQARGLLKAAIRNDNPVVVFEPKMAYALGGEVSSDETPFSIGRIRISRPGKDVTLFAYGMMHVLALRAAARLSAEGIDAEVVDMYTLNPPDRQTMLESVARTGRALIIHEANLSGGYGAEVAATLAEQGFSFLKAPVQRLSGPDVPAVPYSPPMQDWFMPDEEHICRTVKNLLAA